MGVFVPVSVGVGIGVSVAWVVGFSISWAFSGVCVRLCAGACTVGFTVAGGCSVAISSATTSELGPPPLVEYDSLYSPMTAPLQAASSSSSAKENRSGIRFTMESPPHVHTQAQTLL